MDYISEEASITPPTSLEKHQLFEEFNTGKQSDFIIKEEFETFMDRIGAMFAATQNNWLCILNILQKRVISQRNVDLNIKTKSIKLQLFIVLIQFRKSSFMSLLIFIQIALLHSKERLKIYFFVHDVWNCESWLVVIVFDGVDFNG